MRTLWQSLVSAFGWLTSGAELAAARIATLTLAAMLQQLHVAWTGWTHGADANIWRKPWRTIEWSYNLRNPNISAAIIGLFKLDVAPQK
jgi:hypothetical protein